MNIKITKEIEQKLQKHIFDSVEFGNKNGKDKDYLHFVHPNYEMDCSPVQNNHPLFYKDEDANQDNIYVTPRQFIRGIIMGENVLFHEVLEQYLDDSYLSWDFLWPLKGNVIPYKLLKGYIGIAQRDLKQASKLRDGDPKKAKKLYWVENYAKVVCSALGVDYAGSCELLLSTYRDILNISYKEGKLQFSTDLLTINHVNDLLDTNVYINEVITLGIPEIVQLYHSAWIGEN